MNGIYEGRAKGRERKRDEILRQCKPCAGDKGEKGRKERKREGSEFGLCQLMM